MYGYSVHRTSLTTKCSIRSFSAKVQKYTGCDGNRGPGRKQWQNWQHRPTDEFMTNITCRTSVVAPTVL